MVELASGTTENGARVKHMHYSTGQAGISGLTSYDKRSDGGEGSPPPLVRAGCHLERSSELMSAVV